MKVTNNLFFIFGSLSEQHQGRRYIEARKKNWLIHVDSL